MEDYAIAFVDEFETREAVYTQLGVGYWPLSRDSVAVTDRRNAFRYRRRSRFARIRS